MKFYYVYVLHNSAKNFIYIGYSENLRERVISHNKGENKSTKTYVPLELIHYEAYRNMEDAKRREDYLKTNRGRTTLMTMLKDYCKIELYLAMVKEHITPAYVKDSLIRASIDTMTREKEYKTQKKKI
jgi:putative endonuclease